LFSEREFNSGYGVLGDATDFSVVSDEFNKLNGGVFSEKNL